MIAGDVSDEVRRWKLVALASAFVAVAAVAVLIGWIARGSGDANVASASFTGGGWTSIGQCGATEGTRFRIGTDVKVLSADGDHLAIGRILAEPVLTNEGCRQDFIVEGIPSGRGVYLVEIGRWRHPLSEDQLRTNTATVWLM